MVSEYGLDLYCYVNNHHTRNIQLKGKSQTNKLANDHVFL